MPLLGNEGDAGGVSPGISSQNHSGGGRVRPDVPWNEIQENVAQMTRSDEVNEYCGMGKLRLKVGPRHEVVGSASAGVDVVRAPSSILILSQSYWPNPDQRATQAVKLHFQGGFPAPRTGDQLLSGNPATSETTRRVSQPSSSSLSRSSAFLQQICVLSQERFVQYLTAVRRWRADHYSFRYSSLTTGRTILL